MEMPEHVEKREGGYVCRHCQGPVGEDGFSLALDVGDESGEHGTQEEPSGEAFMDALRGGES